MWFPGVFSITCNALVIKDTTNHRNTEFDPEPNFKKVWRVQSASCNHLGEQTFLTKGLLNHNLMQLLTILPIKFSCYGVLHRLQVHGQKMR